MARTHRGRTRARQDPASRSIADDVRPAAGSKLFTLGYQGRDLTEVLQTVQRHRVERVIDVRESASSNKPGFAFSHLKEAFGKIGVAYAHLPELGCARGSRHALWRGGAKEPFLEDYRRRLAERPQAFAELVHRTQSARTLLLCLERDSSRCHRAVLIEKLRAEGIIAQDL